MTARSNFTWGRALGTGFLAQSNTQRTVLDAWDFHANYGPQSMDVKLIYNLTMTYQPTFYKGQKGFLGRLVGGWAFAPIFTARSGYPLRVNTSSGNGQAFGQIFSSSGSSDVEGAILTGPFTNGNSAHYDIKGSNGKGTNSDPATGGSGINMFENPEAAYGMFRRLILGVDHNGGGWGVLRGFPTWNLDMSISKEFRVLEQIGVSLIFQFTNILNHFQPANPSVNLDSPAGFGVVTNQTGNPRQLQFGLRVRF
jgi:hypothetical protein